MNEITGSVIGFVFQMIVAGYILAVCQYGQDTGRQATPGNTPIRRKSNSQTQVPPSWHWCFRYIIIITPVE